jgi:O-acetyl-ADP-ribose deacetylase (regulator of RNase III)
MIWWNFGPGRLALARGDLTRARTDAIVNAANPGLLGGGGVDGAIHRAAGPRLLAACRAIVADIGRLETGRAVITPGFDLPARHVIHTVGPIWRDGGADEAGLLESAYRQSLALAARHGLARIAFPAISCGAYGYPLELAAPIALRALRDGLSEAQDAGAPREATLMLRDVAAYHFWTRQAGEILGAAAGTDEQGAP